MKYGSRPLSEVMRSTSPPKGRDYPRMCGERRSVILLRMPCAGSSPHVRGAPNRARVRARSDGIIPAHAGSTMASNAVSASSQGSSPHVRGAPISSRVSSSLAGIIPACAGSTPLRPKPRRLLRDHPRMCGEHKRSPLCAAMRMGSSPHVRGARPKLLVTSTGDGIIPACAGGTSRPPCWTPYRRDHPRMCGEHCSVLELMVALAGIIPACAGSTHLQFYNRLPPRDHPRMSGEHLAESSPSPTNQGSSPHVRGALSLGVVDSGATGIIPACAGSTPPSPSTAS